MNDNERRYYERAVRVNQFGIGNAGDFSGKATTQFTLINNLVGRPTINVPEGHKCNSVGLNPTYEIKYDGLSLNGTN